MQKTIAIIRSSMKTGGPGRQTLATVLEFSKRGYNTILVTGGGELVEDVKDRDANVKILVLPELLVEGRSVKSCFKLYTELKKINKNYAVDYVYGLNTYSTFMFYIASRCGKKKPVCLNTIVGSGKEWAHKIMPFWHTVCSEEQRKKLVNSGFAMDKLFVNYPTTLCASEFGSDSHMKNEERELLGIPNDAIVIGTAMMEDKGSTSLWKTIERILSQKDNVHFVFIGNSVKFAYNYEQIRDESFKSRIHLLGVRSDMPQILNIIDIFSHLLDVDEYETFGMVITEAMSMEKPVVASNIGGIKDIILEGITGYLVNSDEEYFERINYLIENKERRINMGREGRKRCEQYFTIEKHVDRIEEIFLADDKVKDHAKTGKNC